MRALPYCTDKNGTIKLIAILIVLSQMYLHVAAFTFHQPARVLSLRWPFRADYVHCAVRRFTQNTILITQFASGGQHYHRCRCLYPYIHAMERSSCVCVRQCYLFEHNKRINIQSQNRSRAIYLHIVSAWVFSTLVDLFFFSTFFRSRCISSMIFFYCIRCRCRYCYRVTLPPLPPSPLRVYNLSTLIMHERVYRFSFSL